jgi:hypothetical protein
MSPRQSETVANIRLRKDNPTELTIDDFYEWVIWQYPLEMEGGLCCAVHPPIPNHTWYPAVIGHLDNKIVVHGNINREFGSPREAAEWLMDSYRSS